jgi:DNA-binding transcriptional LysR family regulator
MIPFTFRQIEVFLAVCSAGNFRSAADRLQISQPAVSNQIKALEGQLGTELFLRRRGASCHLSPEGLAFKPSAEQFFLQAQCLGQTASARPRRRAPLRVYVGGHLLEDYVRPAMPSFHAMHPDVELTFLPARSRAQLLQDIRRGLIDIALVTSPRGEETPATLVLGTVPAGIYCRTDRFRTATRADIARLPFILSPEDAPEARLVADLLRSRGIVPTNVAVTTQYHDVKVRMACEGRGALFTIQSIVDHHDPQGLLKLVLAFDSWERRVYVDSQVDKRNAQAVVDFLTAALLPPPRPRERAAAPLRLDTRRVPATTA